ncbi:helix-turn-helix domain-containing protein [Exiguobacterium flavidum]|uniref:helix-turn-helix domain-containing protein n=1 Tax=Exiguobacterium flavidum TaxID=2184695 RepID=UPI0013001888|nr:helix-turn-helix domain-containing protein [Exiguobacterium flavidum]
MVGNQSWSVGNEIKNLRKARGMTQKELCEGICSQAEISKIENGKNSPTVDLLQMIAKRLRVSLSHLFQDQYFSELFMTIDRKYSGMARRGEFTAIVEEASAEKGKTDRKEINLLLDYYLIITSRKLGNVDTRSCASLLSRLTTNEDVWYESPKAFTKIKMGIANLYAEQEEYNHSKKVYESLLEMDYDTGDLRRLRLKIIYNFGQIMYSAGNYQKGLELAEEGIEESLVLADSSQLAHFYYQRACLFEELKINPEQMKDDFTASYALFRAFRLIPYAKMMEQEHAEHLYYNFRR